MSNTSNDIKVIISQKQYLEMIKILKYLTTLISKYQESEMTEDDEWKIFEYANHAKYILNKYKIK